MISRPSPSSTFHCDSQTAALVPANTQSQAPATDDPRAAQRAPAEHAAVWQAARRDQPPDGQVRRPGGPVRRPRRGAAVGRARAAREPRRRARLHGPAGQGAARVVQERLLHVGRQTPLSVRQRRPEQDTAAAAGGAVQEGALRRPRGHRRAVPVPQVRPDDRVPALQQPQDAAVAPQRPLRRVEQLLYSAPVLARAQGAVHLERRGPRVVRILLAAPRTVGAPGQLRKPVRQPDALLRRLGQEDVVRVCRQRDVHCRRVAEIHQNGPAAPKQAGRVRARRHAGIH
ncbi:hypothetical protein KL912_001957 [Ogataea haglerorum]|nr:hypothetical protein KL912_001957 [Ogataea haglerorum]